MLQAVISIGINFFITVMNIALPNFINRNLGLGGLLLTAAYGGIVVLMSVIGLTVYSSTRSKSAANLAQIGFLLFFPIGLIGFFGLRRVRKNETTGNPAAIQLQHKMNPVYIPIIVIFACLIVVGAIIPYFFKDRNLQNLFRQLPIYALMSFGLIMPAREDRIDISIPALMILSAIIFTMGTASANPVASVMLIILSLLTALFFSLINATLISPAGFSSLAATFTTSTALIGTSFCVSGAQTIQAEHIWLAQFPGSWMIFILIGAGIILTGLLKTSGKFEEKRFPSGKMGMKLALTAFSGAAAMAFLAGIYRSARIAAATPAVSTVDMIFILFSFFFLRAFTPGVLKRFGLLLALLSSFIWSTVSNQLNLAGVPFSVHYIVGAYLAIVMGVLSYYVRRKENPATL